MPPKRRFEKRSHVVVKKPVLPILGSVLFLGLLAGGYWIYGRLNPASKEAPEADKILAIQAAMPFQILIPAYLPEEFDRAGVEIRVDEVGPGGEPMIQLMYSTRSDTTLFLKEWVPINPEREILAASHPVETKWGQGWLLTQGESLTALWVDIGPMRISIYSPDPYVIKAEQLLEMAATLGPASNRQVFSFSLDLPDVREVEPPAPYEVPINEGGIQELTLVVTPGGYSPVRFSVKQSVPVHLVFKQLGQVGCGNVLLLPLDSKTNTALTLDTPASTVEFDFTPQEIGDFQFTCSHQMYRGVMKVVP